MAEISTSRLKELLQRTVGPTPWYWKTFPAFTSASGQRFVWSHYGDQGLLAYLVSLSLEQEPEKPRLALNTYCRPFFAPPNHLGIWCPEGRSIRFAGFDPDQLKAFDFAEIAGWFKQSSERIYARHGARCRFRSRARLDRRHAQYRSAIGVTSGGRTDYPHQLPGQKFR